MNNYYVGEVTYKTVSINDHEYQVPTAVANHLKQLDDALDEEREKHEKEVAKLQKIATKDFNTVADRIMTNLNSGVPPVVINKYSREHFEPTERVLSHDLNFFERSEFGEPVLDFKHEVKRRILAGLVGQTTHNEEYK